MSAWVAVVREHPRHVVLFALVAGLVCGAWLPFGVVPVALAAAAVAQRPLPALLAVAAVTGGAVMADVRATAIMEGRLPVRMGERLDVEATVLEPWRRRARGDRVARARIAPDGEAVLLRVGPDVAMAPAAAPGDEVRVAGRLAELGEFERLHRRRGALAALDADAIRTTGRRRGGVLGAVDSARRRALRAMARGLAPPEAALLAGMVLGQDEAIADDVREDFQASGLAHLLAVSGTNVMLLATLALALSALVGVPLRWRLAAALGLIALYVPLTGAGPSIQRAGVMGAAGLVAALAGRPASRWYALGLAAAVTLALNPYAAGEPGWQLSFAAVVGLMVLGHPLRRWFERRVPRPVAEAAAMTVAATITTAPLMAIHFEQLSLVSLPANLLVTAAVAPVMWLGMLAAAVAQVAPPVGAALAAVSGPLVAYVGWVAEVSARVPLSTVPASLSLVLAATAVAAAAFAGRRFWRPVPLRPAAALAVAVFAFLVARPADRPPLRPGETLVTFLDVGQGDATLVQRDGAAVLFDTGPPDGDILGRLRDAGVRRLDALVITHAQADHEGAALAVVRELRPKLVLNGGAGWPTPVQRALPAAAVASRARVSGVAAGDELRLGRLVVRVLWPTAPLAAAPPSGDPNERAVVAHVRSADFDLLLPADAESPVTAGLELPQAEALKVAHHGSEDPGLPGMLDRVRPQIAAIEVGERNSYGHPAPSTLAALKVVPHVVRTDRDGTVRLRVSGGRMRLEAG